MEVNTTQGKVEPSGDDVGDSVVSGYGVTVNDDNQVHNNH